MPNTSQEVLHAFERHRIIPVITIDSVQHALPLAAALLAGGLPIAEITFRTAAAAGVIQLLARERPQLLVGAGTVLTQENLEQAHTAGASFGVAPGFNPRVVKRAAELGLVFIPGICTPTEIEAALEAGSTLLKFFPAGAMGGPKMLKALLAPYLHTGVRVTPTGGVNAENAQEYFAIPSVFAVGGTWLATKEDIEAARWDLITSRCRAAVTSIRAMAPAITDGKDQR